MGRTQPDRLLLTFSPIWPDPRGLRHAFLHRIGVLVTEPKTPVALRAVKTLSLVEGLACINPLLADRLHEPAHDHLGRIVRDGQIVGEILRDLIALLLILQTPQLLVAD